MLECSFITFVDNISSDRYDVDELDSRLRAPIHKAALYGDIGVIKGLIDAKSNLDTVDKDNCTPLQLAIREKNT